MKKASRLIKRYIALLLVLLFSIESFAAIVGDNDGAAFITKAEFDSMKNGFQSQLDRYNSSLDNKIDGAIASYLAGVRVNKQRTLSIIMGSEKAYTMRNGTLNNEYQFPDANVSVSFMKTQYNNGWVIFNIEYKYLKDGIPRDVWDNRQNPERSGNMNVKVIHGWGTLNYGRPTNRVNNQRNTIKASDNIDSLMANTSPLIWRGVAENKLEKWNLAAVWDISNDRYQPMGSSDPGWLAEGYTNFFLFGDVFCFVNMGKLKPSVELANPNWQPGLGWYANTTRYWWDTSLSRIYFSVIPVVDYNKDDENCVWSHEKLGFWMNDTTLECEVEGDTSYANFSTINTLRSGAWFDDVPSENKQGFWSGSEWAVQVRDADGVAKQMKPAGWKIAQSTRWADGEATGEKKNYQIPQLGLLPFRPRADGIYQFYDTLKDSNGAFVPNLKLNQGMPVFPVKLDEKITWELEFKKIEAKDYTDDLEAVLVLSYVPFTSKTTLGNNTDYVDIDGFTRGVTFPETTDKKVKVAFTADRTGYVYAKWYPKLLSQTDIDSKEWEVILDIEKSNTYISESS